jgi:hypothetical protein
MIILVLVIFFLMMLFCDRLGPSHSPHHDNVHDHVGLSLLPHYDVHDHVGLGLFPNSNVIFDHPNIKVQGHGRLDSPP